VVDKGTGGSHVAIKTALVTDAGGRRGRPSDDGKDRRRGVRLRSPVVAYAAVRQIRSAEARTKPPSAAPWPSGGERRRITASEVPVRGKRLDRWARIRWSIYLIVLIVEIVFLVVNYLL
jgi:hypothetical protein